MAVVIHKKRNLLEKRYGVRRVDSKEETRTVERNKNRYSKIENHDYSSPIQLVHLSCNLRAPKSKGARLALARKSQLTQAATKLMLAVARCKRDAPRNAIIDSCYCHRFGILPRNFFASSPQFLPFSVRPAIVWFHAVGCINFLWLLLTSLLKFSRLLKNCRAADATSNDKTTGGSPCQRGKNLHLLKLLLRLLPTDSQQFSSSFFSLQISWHHDSRPAAAR